MFSQFCSKTKFYCRKYLVFQGYLDFWNTIRVILKAIGFHFSHEFITNMILLFTTNNFITSIAKNKLG